jgi:hypothetical protein
MLLRSLGSRALAIGILAIAASAISGGAGCGVTKPTEIVPGALSQIAVPEHLYGIRLQVKANGAVKYDQTTAVQNGVALLPATLGVVSGGGETTVDIIVAGYNANAALNGNGEYAQLLPITEVGTNMNSSPSVRRASVLTYVNQREIFLPMPLSYSCWGSTLNCAGGIDGTTGNVCKANTCQSSNVTSSTLVDYDPSLVDGTQDCFDTSVCFNPQTVSTAILLDSNTCLYEVPPNQTTGLGLNVRVLYQDMKLVLNSATNTYVPQTVPTNEEEILNEEPAGALAEGFVIPDPAKPEQFQVAPGLCSLVKAVGNPPSPMVKQNLTNYHTISAVQVSTACPAKVPLLPICAAEQNVPAVGADGGPTTNVVCDQPLTLDPAPSAVYMVMDNSSIMSGAFGPQGRATAMGLALGNPVFKRTYVAFDFLDHLSSECGGTSTTYTSLQPLGMANATSLDFALANAGQPTVATFLGNPMPPDPPPYDGGTPTTGYAPLYLQAAMRLDKGVYKHLQDFTTGLQEATGISAAMFFINRIPDSTSTSDAGSDFEADGGLNDLLPAPANACSEILPVLPAGVACTAPGGVDCSPALDTMADTTAQNALVQEIVAAANAGLQSYFVILNNGIYEVGTPLPYFQNIQSLVQAQGVTTMQVLDATEPESKLGNILATFSNTVTPLGTCLYELPPGVGPSAQVQFTLPIPTVISQTAPVAVPVMYNPQCNAMTQATQSGWNIESPPGSAVQHLRICGTTSGSCSNLRQSVLAVAAASLSGSGDGGMSSGLSDAGVGAVPEVPVTVTIPCAADAGP